MEKYIQTATNILFDFIKIKQDDTVLILIDKKNVIADSFRKALKENNIDTKKIKITLNRRHSEPIPEVWDHFMWADIIVAPTKNSITHSPQTIKAAKLGKKILSMPSITREIFLSIENADFEGIEKENKKILKQVEGKQKVHITTKRGTNLTFEITKRRWVGLREKRGGFVANLPNGEVFCAPIENSANGKIVMDYWMDEINPKSNATLEIKNGKIVKWSRGAKPFINEHKVKNGFIIAEFGIGTNRSHKKPLGNILYDEKIFKSVHIAFGNNVSFGGKNKSSVHSDMILMKPLVEVNGKKLKW